MKHFSMDRLLFVFIISITSSIGLASEQCAEITISSHPNYPPFHWRDADSLTGASIQISKAILEELNVSVNVEYVGPWKRVLKNAELGNIDFIPALKKTAERQAYLAFTEQSFANNPVSIFVRKGEFAGIQTLEQLIGKFGSINAGDRHGSPIDEFVNSQSTMQRIHGIVQNFQMLELKRTDFFITGKYTGEEFLIRNDVMELYESVLVFEGMEVHNAFTLEYAMNCPEVVRGFDAALEKAKKQGLVAKAIDLQGIKWLELSKNNLVK